MKNVNLLTVKYTLTSDDITVSIKNKEIIIDKEIMKKIREIGNILAEKVNNL